MLPKRVPITHIYSIQKYTNSLKHIRRFKLQCRVTANNNDLLVKQFSLSLGETTLLALLPLGYGDMDVVKDEKTISRGPDLSSA